MWRSCCSGVVEIVVVAHGMAEVVVGLEMVGLRFASSCNSCLDYVGLVVACLCSLFCFDTFVDLLYFQTVLCVNCYASGMTVSVLAV